MSSTTLGIPCNACANGFCGNCVGDKLETTGFIQDAKFHCVCASNSHKNHTTKNIPNKAVFSKKKDDEPVHIREIKPDTDDDFRDDDT